MMSICELQVLCIFPENSSVYGMAFHKNVHIRYGYMLTPVCQRVCVENLKSEFQTMLAVADGLLTFHTFPPSKVTVGGVQAAPSTND